MGCVTTLRAVPQADTLGTAIGAYLDESNSIALVAAQATTSHSVIPVPE